MSWLYSRALVEEYSEERSLDGEPCALWNGTHTQRASWLPAKTTKACRLSRSGTTFKPLTDNHGEAVLTSCLGDSLVKTLVQPAKEPGSTENEAVCGDTWLESSMKFDPDSSSWKTHHSLWDEDLPESSVTLPKWGMMQGGVLWERTTLPPLTSGTGAGSWPTPNATDHKHCVASLAYHEKRVATPGKQISLATAVRTSPNGGKPTRQMWQTPTAMEGADCGSKWESLKKIDKGGRIQRQMATKETKETKETTKAALNPSWVEWLMGWPIGWTDLNAAATDKFQRWLHSHGKH
jgi:hypothetical protein